MGAAASAAPTPTRRVVGNLDDPKYLNWLKANRALHRTVEVLRNVCWVEMQFFQNSLLSKHGSTRCSKPCTHKDVITHDKGKSWSVPCPTRVCSNWLADIVREKSWKSTRLRWQNSDLNQWQAQPWQIAKVYMDREDRACINPTNTDAAGVLQLLINCKRFKTMMDSNRVKAVSSCSFLS